MKWSDTAFIWKAEGVSSQWVSHTMAPAAYLVDAKTIRIYVGGWDGEGISRIWYVDVLADQPEKILNVSKAPVLDIGRDGTFDENGVFPGHVYRDADSVLLYYTGFQLGHKIRHYNFGGLAVSRDGKEFQRVSEAPLLDRADEGLHVRAGQSVIKENNFYKSVYSAGTGWLEVGGKDRPVYEVYYQESSRADRFEKHGKKIIALDASAEHGLGRPQIVKFRGKYLVFYTRRTLDMRYHFGVAVSEDGSRWIRRDNDVNVPHSKSGFDSEMVYFPCAVPVGDHLVVFYSGNGFGKEGMGFVRLEGL